MKTRIYLSIIGLMAFSFLFVSCSKDDEGDTVKPVIICWNLKKVQC